jgi:hypothetical protein
MTLSLAGALGGFGPPIAHGQEPDPDSPAGVEYQLPLDRARKESATKGPSGPRGPGGKDRAVTGGGDAARLFGAGIEPPTTAATARQRGSKAPGSSPGDRSSSPNDSRTSHTASAGGSGLDMLPFAIAAGVLVVGGVLGLGLRSLLRALDS